MAAFSAAMTSSALLAKKHSRPRLRLLALKAIGEHERDKTKASAILKTARAHYNAALEEFRKADASYYVKGTEANIAALDRVMAGLGVEKAAQ